MTNIHILSRAIDFYADKFRSAGLPLKNFEPATVTKRKSIPDNFLFENSDADTRLTISFYSDGDVILSDFRCSDGSTFIINDYLTATKQKKIPTLRFSGQPDFENYCQFYLEKILRLLNGELKEVVLGKVDLQVPRNYSGYGL